MMKRYFLAAMSGAFGLALMAGSAQAGLMGDEVKLTCSGGNITLNGSSCPGGPVMATETVGSDAEFFIGADGLDGDVLSIDVAEDGVIALTNVLGTGQDILIFGPVFRFDFPNMSRIITDFAFSSVPGETETSGIDLDFGDSYVQLTFTGNPNAQLDNGNTLSLQAQIPAPATLGLLGMGLMGLGVAARRRRRHG